MTLLSQLSVKSTRSRVHDNWNLEGQGLVSYNTFILTWSVNFRSCRRTVTTFVQEENDAISTLAGFSLDHVLNTLDLPSGSGLSRRLGLGVGQGINSSQIFSDDMQDDDDAIGAGQGQDWEDEVNRELEAEGSSDVDTVKAEVLSPGIRQKQKRVRIIRRLVERPKTVHERFPTFGKDKILDFTDLFKGYTVRKSRLSKRPFHCALNHIFLKTNH